MIGEGGTNGSHTNSSPTSVPLTAARFQIKCRLDDDDDDDNDGDDDDKNNLNIHAQAQHRNE
jgi:hypothetical protein